MLSSTLKQIVLFFLLAIPLSSFASDFGGVLLTSSPENPRPSDRVLFTAKFIGDDGGSIYTWKVNGNRVAQGVDLKTLSVDAPSAGKSSVVGVEITSGGRTIGAGEYTLRPAEVTIEWEGRGTRPPFYVGRSLMVSQGVARAVALPSFITTGGAKVRATDIQYTWKINGQVQQKYSGYGRDTILVQSPFYDDAFRLSVIAATKDGSITAEDFVDIRPVAPQVIVYELSPLGGIQDARAVSGTYPFTTDEVSFMAYPLFVDPSDTTVAWTLNNEPVALDTGNPRLAVFKKTGAGSGSYSVGISVTSPTKFLMHAVNSFLLTF